MNITELIKGANTEAFLCGVNIVFADVVLIYLNREAVGFACPHVDSKGFHRCGPIYIAPKYRNKGAASEFVSKYFTTRSGRAFIDDRNKTSIQVFTNAGFTKTGKTHIDAKTGDLLHEYTN